MLRIECKRFANQVKTTGSIALAFDANGIASIPGQPGANEAIDAFLRRWHNHGARELRPLQPELAKFPIPPPAPKVASGPVLLPSEVAHPAFAPVPESEIVPDDDDLTAGTSEDPPPLKMESEIPKIPEVAPVKAPEPLEEEIPFAPTANRLTEPRPGERAKKGGRHL
jgi:hypothetical protein